MNRYLRETLEKIDKSPNNMPLIIGELMYKILYASKKNPNFNLKGEDCEDENTIISPIDDFIFNLPYVNTKIDIQPRTEKERNDLIKSFTKHTKEDLAEMVVKLMELGAKQMKELEKQK